ncbi:hypothetical protein [Aureimonas sp. AU4]|uniref:hypothetical protein n=1 Tax=Aureimonas sp. AU4 TaxID=1638163 RepID=UPI000782041D|nr:hypothetical protein [Aureimonas sp. AU4]
MSRSDTLVRAAFRGLVSPMSHMTTMSLAPAGRATWSRSAQGVAAANEGLRPAKGLLIGLGLSSLMWSALVALFIV